MQYAVQYLIVICDKGGHYAIVSVYWCVSLATIAKKVMDRYR